MQAIRLLGGQSAATKHSVPAAPRWRLPLTSSTVNLGTLAVYTCSAVEIKSWLTGHAPVVGNRKSS